MNASGIVTLLSDFGAGDAYVGAMKGALLSANGAARIVDVTHDVPGQDVHAGAWLLRAAYRYFPAGTVHVAVVDPGVGTARWPIAARAGAWLFVGPDNGVLTVPLTRESPVEVVRIEEARYMRGDVSATFHGRDVFAPVAGHLAAGVPLRELGPKLDRPALLALPSARVDGEAIIGEVVYVDRFGNLITNIELRTLREWSGDWTGARVEIAGERFGPIRSTYGDVADGAPVALIGSNGDLEIAVRNGSAAARLGVRRSAVVRVTRAERE
jgi:hypothetical protein